MMSTSSQPAAAAIPKDGRSARWEQAFSSDGGITWETNWTMDFSRVEE